jgi:hypothetical protein
VARGPIFGVRPAFRAYQDAPAARPCWAERCGAGEPGPALSRRRDGRRLLRRQHDAREDVHDVARHRDVQARSAQVLLRPDRQEPVRAAASAACRLADLCFSGRTGSKAPKPDVTTTDQFGTQHLSLTGLDYACANVSLSGPAPAEAWILCFNQKTKDALNPPNVFLTTQDLGQFSDMRVDPIDEVCVQTQVQ